MYQALYRKWRPKLFDDVVGQSHITETLKRQVAAGRTSHAYLFTGTRGTGKTTCAKILAKAVNCEHPIDGNPCGKCPACRGIEDGSILDVVELDAASNNGVDQVRALREEAVFAPAAVKKRVYIVDEVHMLSVAAFNALLKILEEPPEHLMFILATTELHKVPATILSRCQRFSFKRIQAADIAGRLNYVSRCEGIDLTEDAAALLARLADGGLRDALSLLDQCTVAGGWVDKALVLDTLGLAGNLQTAHIMNDIRRGDTAAALSALAELYANGKDVSAVLDELAQLCRDLLIRKTAPQGADLMAGGYDEATLKALEGGFTAQRLLYLLSLLQDTLSNLKNSANRRTNAELCLIRMCDTRLEDSPAALSARIARLEAAVAAGGVAAPPVSVPAKPASEPQQPQPVPPAAPEEPSAASEDTPPWSKEAEPLLPQEPPVEAEALPPWEPTVEAAPPKSPVTRASSPRSAATAQAAVPEGGDRFWLELLPDLRSAVGPAAYPFLSNGAMCAGALNGDVLTVSVRDEFSRRIVHKPKVLEGVASAATARAGRPIRVELVSGSAPSSATPASGRRKRPPEPPARQQTAPPQPVTPATQAPASSGSTPFQELLDFAEQDGKGIITVTD
ncbi:MAG: DNA polymerase III subunit gamma/tau [Clostridiales bacterium]|nr:DNA polymerase III subunit gamma/tau [Clostridiales bacterium]